MPIKFNTFFIIFSYPKYCSNNILTGTSNIGAVPDVPIIVSASLLFSSLTRWEAFPIDVWVRRVMNELYIKNEDETKVNKKELENLAKEKYGNLAGIAQQYLFYWRREA